MSLQKKVPLKMSIKWYDNACGLVVDLRSFWSDCVPVIIPRLAPFPILWLMWFSGWSICVSVSLGVCETYVVHDLVYTGLRCAPSTGVVHKKHKCFFGPNKLGSVESAPTLRHLLEDAPLNRQMVLIVLVPHTSWLCHWIWIHLFFCQFRQIYFGFTAILTLF